MRYFAGLDVSLEETAICVVDENGGIVKEARASSEPDALVATLQGMDLALERVGLEARSLTAWLWEGLTQAGQPAICIETQQANAAMKTMPNKTDRNDARALAQIMRAGWFRQVHAKSRLRRSGSGTGQLRYLRDAAGRALACRSCHDVTRTRPADQASARYRPRGEGLSPSDDCSGRWPDHGACLPGHDRPAGSVQKLSSRGSASGPDAGAIPIRRDRRPGQGEPMWRRARPHGALRSGSFGTRAQQEMVGSARLGYADRQAPRHGTRSGRGRPQARRHPASHMDRRDGVPLRQESRFRGGMSGDKRLEVQGLRLCPNG